MGLGPLRWQDQAFQPAAAHPAYTSRFQSDLKRPGIRVPVTADATLFVEAVAIGRE